MSNIELLTPHDLYALVSQAALSKPEKRSVLAVASQALIHSGSDEPPLHRALQKAAAEAKVPPAARLLFINRVITRFNRYGEAQYVLPTRRIQKDTSALAAADFAQGYWGALIPALLVLAPPGPFRLALLMAYSMGFGKRAIDAQLLVGESALRDDGAFCVPIAKFDSQHHHIIWLPAELKADVTKCLAVTKVFEDQRRLTRALNLLFGDLQRAFNRRKNVSSKDRSVFAKRVMPLRPMAHLEMPRITVPALLEAARVHGVAKRFPGYLRDMLNQSVLPASVVRTTLRGVTPRPAPVSPNAGVRNATVAEKALELANHKQDGRYLDLLSNADGLPDEVWLEWQRASLNWVKQIVRFSGRETVKPRELTVALVGDGRYIGRNSWCAWAVQFLLEEGRRQSWADSTWLKYRSILFSPEVSALTAAFDVEEFDEEDLEMLIDELKSRKNSPKTLETKIALICRMIKFAQGQQPDYAFPLVSITIEGKSPQLNKRSHILTPAETELLVERQIQVGNVDAALVLALIGFAGMRPIEIIYLQKAGITLLPNALEINIERSKTPAGKRCLPIHALAPKAMHDFMLKELAKRCNSGESADVFFEDNVVKVERREKLITPALVTLREKFGEGIDLYTLRHSFASWSFVRLIMGAYGDASLLTNSPNLQHEIFCSGLKPFAELVFQQQPYCVDPSSFYRLARLLGHATPETLPRTYLHTAGFVHSAFLAR